MSDCRVYWGSHGCVLPKGHLGSHECDCCECPDHALTRGVAFDDFGEYMCVAKPPYYGPDTHFYGEDVATKEDS